MVEKLKLKAMDKKQLHKVAKTALKEVASLGTTQVELERQIEAWKELRVRWKEQFDSEVFYKNQAINESKLKDDHIHKLEFALTALGYDPKGMSLANAVELGTAEGMQMVREHWLKANNYEPLKSTYIGEMPDNLQMDVDGQLKDEESGHQPFDEPTNGVTNSMELGTAYHNALEEEYRDKIVEEADLENIVKKMKEGGYSIGNVTFVANEVPKEHLESAVAWAERNGHHQPKGNPEPNKMDSVRVKSADEISEENRQNALLLSEENKSRSTSL